MKEYEDMEFRQFTAKSESDKAINTLKGILIGINLDNIVNEIELKELNDWCSQHYKLIDRNPFKELMLLIKEANTDVNNRHESLMDLIWLCERYGEGSVYYDFVTSELQLLEGICHGIIADGKIDDDEVKNLYSWMNEHDHLISYYPFDEIKSLLLSVLSDGKIDDNERTRLLAYFNKFSKIVNKDVSNQIELSTLGLTLSGICTSDLDIKFKGSKFCFTGAAKRATRKELKEKIEDLGGLFSETLTQDTQYLVVGDNGNVCWAFACYGRKVEKAQTMRKNGSKISIVHEFDFWDYVDDLPYMDKK